MYTPHSDLFGFALSPALPCCLSCLSLHEAYQRFSSRLGLKLWFHTFGGIRLEHPPSRLACRVQKNAGKDME